MAKKNNADGMDKEGGKILTVLIALLIAIIWFAIFGILIKFDVGGFGSGVLRPIIKDVPLINKIFPDISEEELANERIMIILPTEAVAKIKDLLQIDKMKKVKEDSDKILIDG